jgi:rubredoxin
MGARREPKGSAGAAVARPAPRTVFREVNEEEIREPPVRFGPAEVGESVSARNQLLFREVNERIADLTRDWSETGVSLFICECSDPACAEALEITPAEYEQVRADGARFVVLRGHEQPEVERVVDGCSRFLVVEKTEVLPPSHATPIHAAMTDLPALSEARDPSPGHLSQFRCTNCGYGASCKREPERCPMCGGRGWRQFRASWVRASGRRSQQRR